MQLPVGRAGNGHHGQAVERVDHRHHHGGQGEEQEMRAREQQAKIESLTERVIRLETQMDMLLIGAGAKRRQGRLES